VVPDWLGFRSVLRESNTNCHPSYFPNKAELSLELGLFCFVREFKKKKQCGLLFECVCTWLATLFVGSLFFFFSFSFSFWGGGGGGGAFGVCGSTGVLALLAVGGVLFDRVSPQAPFVLVGAVNLAAGVAASAVWIRRPRLVNQIS
jgi:hypothetical protein